MDYNERTRKNAPHNTLQNASTHHPDDKKPQEDCTHDEHDRDSGISFDDEGDSTASQEDDIEDWFKYMKKKHQRS